MVTSRLGGHASKESAILGGLERGRVELNAMRAGRKCEGYGNLPNLGTSFCSICL